MSLQSYVPSKAGRRTAQTMNKKIKQGGFTLIQVMFVISIIGVVMFLSLENQLTSTKIKKTADFNSQVAEISDYISTLLEDPYICSASVEGVKLGSILGGSALGGGTSLGQAIGGDAGFNDIKDAGLHPLWNDDSRNPTIKFFQPRGRPHLTKNTEIRPGIMVTDLRLLRDGFRHFIRITFEPIDRIASSKMGGRVINKDFYLYGVEDGNVPAELTECNILERDENLREVCIGGR